MKYITYYLNNISAVKEHPKYKTLGTPKIHLEFDLSSHDFLVFEAADIVLNETIIVEVEDKVFPESKNKRNDTKKAKNETKNETKTEEK